MPGKRLVRVNGDLSEFLQRSRGRLTPEAVGLPPGMRRRAPGLRREEVAALAGVGLTWYTWFEQGRDIQVSERFLLRVAEALRLDDAECSHLFLLAHNRPPPTEPRQAVAVSPLVRTLLDDLALRPAYVLNALWDLVAWNEPAETLFGLDRDDGDRNLLGRLFGGSGLRERLPAWNREGPALLAQYRYDSAFAAGDPAAARLVERLKAQSDDFRRWWVAPTSGVARYGIGSIIGTDGRRLTLRHERLIVDEHLRLQMVVYFVDP
jgi:transcriptional regulator with XRE-family HTH domain